MSVGEITHAEVVTGEPKEMRNGMALRKKIEITNADGRRWARFVYFQIYDTPQQQTEGWRDPYRIDCGEIIYPASDLLGVLCKATPDQVMNFTQDDAAIRWPDLGVMCFKDEPFLFDFDLIGNEQARKEQKAFSSHYIKKSNLEWRLSQIQAVLDNPKDPNHINNLAIYRQDKKDILEEIRMLNITTAIDWPVTDQEGSPAQTEPPEMTGTVATGTEEAKKKPGRPANTDYAAIEAELRRRAEAGEMLMRLQSEMNYLETWAKLWAEKQNPPCQSSAAGNIGKHFRGLYKTLKSDKIEKEKAD